MNSRLVLALILAFFFSPGVRNVNSQPASRFPADRAKLAREITDEGTQHIHMPRLPLRYSADRYIDVTPEYLRDSLKGKVVLIDIWDYTCINCIQTLPYIKAWNEKYKKFGLVILGVHSPEFEFEKDPTNLDSAVKAFGITYPVIADNDYEIWNSLANQYWPAKYLFDSHGVLRASHFGEGEYREFEAFLQKILHERNPKMALPPLEPLVRETDAPGAVCYRPSPETYVGFYRNHLGNPIEHSENKDETYSLPKELKHDLLYLDGPWRISREYAQPSGNSPAALVFNYQAYEANLVIHPLAESGFRVEVTQDGKPVAPEDRGSDIEEADGKTFITVGQARMYRITKNKGFGRHVLRLMAATPSFGVYAFTFTTSCRK